jgi:hypothetical protein
MPFHSSSFVTYPYHYHLSQGNSTPFHSMITGNTTPFLLLITRYHGSKPDLYHIITGSRIPGSLSLSQAAICLDLSQEAIYLDLFHIIADSRTPGSITGSHIPGFNSLQREPYAQCLRSYRRSFLFSLLRPYRRSTILPQIDFSLLRPYRRSTILPQIVSFFTFTTLPQVDDPTADRFFSLLRPYRMSTILPQIVFHF